MERRDDSLIILLFSVLPLIDTLNGMFRGYPIGISYKIGLCLLLMLIICFRDGFIREYVAIMTATISYVFLSIMINLAMGGKVFNFDFPIKLVFNIILICLMIICLREDIISGKALYSILDISSWVFVACFLIPYFWGTGNKVYAIDDGYKAFFISQNELSIVVAVMSFFTAYKLIIKVKLTDVIRLVLFVLIGMLLNTKAAMLASIIAVLLWGGHVMIKSSIGVKIVCVAIIASGFVALRSTIVNAITTAVNRYKHLESVHGGQLAGILSGRNRYLDIAIKEFANGNRVLRIVIGNGFCSDTHIEMDLLDIFFYLGSIGLVAEAVFLILILVRSYRIGKMDRSAFRPISLTVIILMMVFSGHLLFMSMSWCYFAIYVCFLLFYDNPGVKGTNCRYESVDKQVC